MQKLSPGTFQGNDGEAVTIDVTSTGAQTLFGVTASMNGEAVPVQGQRITITLDKSKAHGESFITNAKSTILTLEFNFTSQSGGRYELTLNGSGGGGTFTGSVDQVGITPEAINYIFH